MVSKHPNNGFPQNLRGSKHPNVINKLFLYRDDVNATVCNGFVAAADTNNTFNNIVP